MIGRALKHYEVEAPLGKGGMGEVYRARDTRLGRSVALKVLPEEAVHDPDRRRRFLQEARAACAVNHPAIAQVYDVDEADGNVFLAMELVDGKTVRALLQGRELDLLGSLEIASQLAGGLAKAHEAGIVHRDIKPENVMLTRDGHAKLLDFGLAKLLEPPASGDGRPPDELSHMETLARTQAGFVVGTLRYMSPEQARGRAVDARSDIFSMGVLLYEMVTGRLPFQGESPLDTLHAIAFEESQPVSALRPNLPASLQRVVTRCLRKQPSDRYPDARALLSDLEAVQREVESGGGSGVPTPPAERALELLRRSGASPGEALAFAVALLAALATLVLLWRGGGSVALAIVVAFFGLTFFRRLRNRRYYQLRALSRKIRKLPEVRLIAVQGQRISVVVDRALAKTYVRIHALVDDWNAALLLGEPFSVVVRDDAAPDELRALLAGPGVLYVRDDVPMPPSPPSASPPPLAGGRSSS